MASQLIVKSEMANAWGGRTIWVIQHQLADYIRKSTGLRLDALRKASWVSDEVNVVSASLDEPNDIRLYAGRIGEVTEEAVWWELVRSPGLPSVEVLERRLSERVRKTRLRVR